MIGYVGLIALLCLFDTSFAAMPTLNRCPVTLDKVQYNQCIANEIAKMTPYLKIGIPELNIPALEPYTGDPITKSESFPGIYGSATVKNYKVSGITNYTIKDIDANPNNLTVTVKFYVPKLHVSGDCEITGSMLKLPINIVGSGTETIYGMDITVHIAAEEVIDKSGIKRYKIKKIKSELYLDHGKCELTANFWYYLNAKAAQALFNKFSHTIYQILNPAIEEYFTATVRDIGDMVAEKFSVDDLTAK